MPQIKLRHSVVQTLDLGTLHHNSQNYSALNNSTTCNALNSNTNCRVLSFQATESSWVSGKHDLTKHHN